jgi:hypothetical protein
MSDTNPAAVSAETIAQDFAAAMQGRMEPHQIDAAVQKIRTASSSHLATYYFDGWSVYITIRGGKIFIGGMGFNATSGAGWVHTHDLDLLYADTVYFLSSATRLYFSVVFLDANSIPLGVFHGTSIWPVMESGEGQGSWS